MAFKPFRLFNRGFRFGRGFVRGFGRGFRRGFNNTVRPPARLLNKTIRTVNFLNRYNNAEKKWFDTSGDVSPSSVTGMTPVWLSAINVGTNSQTRIGQSVKALSLSLRLRLTLFPQETVAQTARIIIYYVTETPGSSVGTAGELLAGPEFTISPLNMNTAMSGKYKILKDFTMLVSSLTYDKIEKKVILKLGHHIKWDIAGTTISDALRGHIFMLAISNAVIGQEPSLYYHARLRFVDN